VSEAGAQGQQSMSCSSEVMNCYSAHDSLTLSLILVLPVEIKSIGAPIHHGCSPAMAPAANTINRPGESWRITKACEQRVREALLASSGGQVRRSLSLLHLHLEPGIGSYGSDLSADKISSMQVKLLSWNTFARICWLSLVGQANWEP